MLIVLSRRRSGPFASADHGRSSSSLQPTWGNGRPQNQLARFEGSNSYSRRWSWHIEDERPGFVGSRSAALVRDCLTERSGTPTMQSIAVPQ